MELKGSLIVDEPGKMGGGLELTSSSLMNQVKWKGFGTHQFLVYEPGEMGGGLELTSSSLMNQVRWEGVWNSSAPRCLTR